MEHPNVIMLKGNQEVMAIDALKGYIANNKKAYYLEKTDDNLDLWFSNGGHLACLYLDNEKVTYV